MKTLTVSKQTKKFVHAFGVNYYKKVGDFHFNVGFHERNEKKIKKVKAPTHADGVWSVAIIIKNKILREGDKIKINGKVRTLMSEKKTSEHFSKHGKHNPETISFSMAGALCYGKIGGARIQVITYSYDIKGKLYDFTEIVGDKVWAKDMV